MKKTCDSCRGSKKTMGLGLVKKDCKRCHGRGFLDEEVERRIAAQIGLELDKMRQEKDSMPLSTTLYIEEVESEKEEREKEDAKVEEINVTSGKKRGRKAKLK